MGKFTFFKSKNTNAPEATEPEIPLSTTQSNGYGGHNRAESRPSADSETLAPEATIIQSSDPAPRTPATGRQTAPLDFAHLPQASSSVSDLDFTLTRPPTIGTSSRRSSRSTLPPPSSPPPCIPLPPIPVSASLPLGARLPLSPTRLASSTPIPYSPVIIPASPISSPPTPHPHLSAPTTHLPISESTQSLSTTITTVSSIEYEKAAAVAAVPAAGQAVAGGESSSTDIEGQTQNSPSSGFSAFIQKHFGPPTRVIWGLTRNTFLYVAMAVIYLFLAGIVAVCIVYGPGKGASKGGSGGIGNGNGIETNLPLDPNALLIGDLTYYAPGLGSCGLSHTDSDAVVAISHVLFDAANISGNPNENPLCGRKVRATRFREDTGKNVTVEAIVVDRCPACKRGDLDASPAVFDKLARPEQGRVDITWSWV